MLRLDARSHAKRLGLYAAPLAALVAAWLLFLPGIHVFPLDDAYIHLAYVRTLTETGLLALNPGEPSLGTSSQLWVYLLAALRVLHLLDDYWCIEILALALLAGTVVVTTGIVRDATRRLLGPSRDATIAGMVAGCLVALNGDVQWMGGAGMETPLALFLPFLAIWLFCRNGFTVAVGILCGLTFAARSPGAILPTVLLAIELARGRFRKSLAGCAATALTALPFVAIAWHTTGGVVPTSAQGKLITYVDHGIDLDGCLHFVGRFLALQKYLPHSIVLMSAGLWGGAIIFAGTERFPVRLDRALDAYPEFVVVSLFGFAHFVTYMFGFRSLGQQGRYLIEEQVVFAIVGVIGFAIAAHGWLARWRAVVVAATTVTICVAGLPYWRRVYVDNVRHVEAVYTRMGHFIATYTPADARVAAFDIGVLRYIGNRYAVDLGGLIDPASHSCLRRHDCGKYARDMGATYILYSKEPEADNITGLFLSETAPGLVLRQTTVAQFAYADYEAPTLTHSLKLVLTRVDGWMPRHSGELRDSFVASPDASFQKAHGAAGDGLELVGSSVDSDGVRFMRDYPYFLRMTLYYFVAKPQTSRRWMHLAFFDDESGRIVRSEHDLVTRDLLSPSEMPVGKVIKDEHVFPVTYGALGNLWHLRVAFSDTEAFDDRYPNLYEWTTLADYTNRVSAMNPLAPR